MRRLFAIVGLAILVGACGTATAVPGDIAPTNLTIVAEVDPALDAQDIFVLNNSSVPIVVTSVRLEECQNVEQACTLLPLHLTIAPRNRRRIATVSAADPTHGYNYHYSWSWTSSSPVASDRPATIRSAVPGQPGVTRVDSVVSREVLTPEALQRLQAAGTTVDTIIATPDTVILHVGERTPPASLVSVVALDSSGHRVEPFSPTFIMPRSSVYAFRSGTFEAVAAGEAVFFVEALPRMTDRRGHPSTAVVLKVLP